MRGALLVVDASQGVEAQTVANCYTAIEQGVEVVPCSTRSTCLGQPGARNPGDRGRHRIEAKDAVRASAKTGEGVDDILEAVIHRIPPPKGDPMRR